MRARSDRGAGNQCRISSSVHFADQIRYPHELNDKRLRSSKHPLDAALGTVQADQWDSPSPCEGWTVRDVVEHLMETQREFLGRNNIDIGKVPGFGEDPASAWRSHTAAVLDAVSTEAVINAEFDGAFVTLHDRRHTRAVLRVGLGRPSMGPRSKPGAGPSVDQHRTGQARSATLTPTRLKRKATSCTPPTT